jgi:alkanesulfonate monooxygenase SsuD/methylene tetrahydromethanopterin reductase-like flavin-dependent oxidoreductase (luciferase family)
MATKRVKVGLMVGANTFRNPGLVAKIVTTLERLAGDVRPLVTRRLG